MDGYFQFRYLKPGEIPNENPEKLEDIDPALLFRVNVQPVLLRLQQGQEFIANPCIQLGTN